MEERGSGAVGAAWCGSRTLNRGLAATIMIMMAAAGMARVGAQPGRSREAVDRATPDAGVNRLLEDLRSVEQLRRRVAVVRTRRLLRDGRLGRRDVHRLTQALDGAEREPGGSPAASPASDPSSGAREHRHRGARQGPPGAPALDVGSGHHGRTAGEPPASFADSIVGALAESLARGIAEAMVLSAVETIFGPGDGSNQPAPARPAALRRGQRQGTTR